MKEQKQKIYLLLVVGITLFISSLFILIPSIFNINTIKDSEIKDVVLANITTQSADMFWKGYTGDDNFRVLYKETNSTGLYTEFIPTQVFTDLTYPNGYMYLISLNSLSPNTFYDLEIWDDNLKLFNTQLLTLPISDEILPPEPISGESFSFDWIRLSDDSSEYIVRTDASGSWSLDSNLLSTEYEIEIYSSFNLDEDSVLGKYLGGSIYAADIANCDEISYSGVASDIRNKAQSVQTILATVQAGGGGNPQYLRCYEDVYCEAEKAGIDPRWTLTDWVHESNASDYQYPGVSLFADFGVECCGVPVKHFQAQLGFFLSLSHDPCGCSTTGCTNDEYYCCWANNYLFGTKSKQCTDHTRSYINGLLVYYNMIGVNIAQVKDLPMPLKTSGKNITCGDQDAIEIYQKVVNGEYEDPIIEEPLEEDGICCALKISGKDNLQGDYESISTKTCDQIWEIGRAVYGGRIEYSVELEGLNRNSCEKQWSGVCCDISGEYQWLPSSVCSKELGEFDTYNACMEAGGERIDMNLELDHGYNFTSWLLNDVSNPIMASSLLNNSSIILVAGFHNGVWDQLMYKESGDINGLDFEMESGQAYLITTTQATTISISGVRFINFDWGVLKGWQFVPAGAFDSYSNTKRVVLSFDTVNISQVALWSKDLGKFKYFVYDVTGEEFGEVISFSETQGVFVRIE